MSTTTHSAAHSHHPHALPTALREVAKILQNILQKSTSLLRQWRVRECWGKLADIRPKCAETCSARTLTASCSAGCAQQSAHPHPHTHTQTHPWHRAIDLCGRADLYLGFDRQDTLQQACSQEAWRPLKQHLEQKIREKPHALSFHNRLDSVNALVIRKFGIRKFGNSQLGISKNRFSPLRAQNAIVFQGLSKTILEDKKGLELSSLCLRPFGGHFFEHSDTAQKDCKILEGNSWNLIEMMSVLCLLSSREFGCLQLMHDLRSSGHSCRSRVRQLEVPKPPAAPATPSNMCENPTGPCPTMCWRQVLVAGMFTPPKSSWETWPTPKQRPKIGLIFFP